MKKTSKIVVFELGLQLLFAAPLLLGSCASSIYHLSGGKTPRIENAASIQTFLQREEKPFGQHVYWPAMPFDTVKLVFNNDKIENRFFDKTGTEWTAKDGDNDPLFFLHHAQQPDSLAKYFLAKRHSPQGIDSLLTSLRTLNGESLQQAKLADKDFTLVLPWAIYAYKALYKDEARELQKVLENYPAQVAVLRLNTDFNESWGLPLGYKVPTKTKWLKKERSIEATYNVAPLMKQ